MSKNTKNTTENAEINEVSNVEVNNVSNEVENDLNLTPEQNKAARILRAKLPALNARNFNFEKRTGSVFTASIVKVFDADGVPVIENGEHKEKLVRKVVEIENEAGELLPEFSDIADDLKAKRAAALVLTADTQREKLEAKRDALVNELQDVKNALVTVDEDIKNAAALVMSVSLPEAAPRAATATVTAKLNEATSKIDKMRAMLMAAGFSEDEINEQLNG